MNVVSGSTPSRKVIYIGNFVSGHSGTKPYCETLSSRLEKSGFEVVRASSEQSRVRRWLSMLRAASGARPGVPVLIDVFSTAAFLWAESSCLVAAARGGAVALILRGGALPRRGETSGRRLKALFARSRLVVTPSKYLQRSLAAYAPSGIHYLPNAIDISRYPFRQRPYPSPRIVWLRALARDYLPEVAVTALAELRKAIPDATLLLAGPDKKDGTLQRVLGLIEALGLRKAIELRGSLPKARVPAFLQEGDVFLNTTLYESFGVSVMEAAASGLCIVTTNVGELPYLWDDGEEALLVPPGDPATTADSILRILREPGLAGRLSSAGRRKAEVHDWSKVLPLWVSLLTRLSVDE